jgi:hypothetical protein
MRGSTRSILVAALASCAVGALSVVSESAPAATIEDEATAMLAIYGSPGTNGTAVPVGGGLGRNFGFGKNMLFQACAGCTVAVGENFSITVGAVVAEAKDAYLGGTLMANKTGTNNPLSFRIEFVDLQDDLLGGVATPVYADTSDRPWISEICSPAAAANACKVDAQFAGAAKGAVKIDDASFVLVTASGPIVLQGPLWGTWENGAAGVPPGVKLEIPAAGHPTLVVTQTFAGGPALGAAIEAIKGKFLLISANNDWYKVKAGEAKEPAITIAN